MSNARFNILQRLREPQRAEPGMQAERGRLSRFDWSREERIERFKARMEAVRAEVHVSDRANWLAVLEQVCRDKRLNNLLLSPSTTWGQAIHEQAGHFPALKSYEQPIESWKEELFFGVDAGLTATLGG
ncbi:MAG: lactate utilization protein, partial [Thiolinea sp.]